MTNRMLWRHEHDAVMVPVDSAQVIEVGDLIWLNTDDGRPAGQVSYAGGLATAQEALVDDFLGVAMSQSISGDIEEVRVKTRGVFEFDCASATFELGDLIAAAANAGNTALENQKVVSLGDGHADVDVPRAIGKVYRRVPTAATKVLVTIRSTVMDGGYQLGTASA